MSQQFQILVDARGDLWASDGIVIDHDTGDAFEIGTLDPPMGAHGSTANHLAEGLEIPPVAGSTLLGGSGRNVIVSGPAGIAGVYRPGRPGIWKRGDIILEVTGPSAATLSDGTTIAELTSGGDAPAGAFVATSYGEDTYNASSAFTADAVKETDWPGSPNALEITISAGTAMGGIYTSTDGVSYVSDVDADWTLTLAADGSVELAYLGEVMALRATGEADDPCGQCEATEAGKRLNPEFPEVDETAASDTNPFGLLTLVFTWSGTPDLDIGVSFLGDTAGYGYSDAGGGAVGDYMTYSGDNITTGGPETVVIDLAAAWDAGAIDTYADVMTLADWYSGSSGSGPASLEVTYDGGAPVTYTLHPRSDSPAKTQALALRVSGGTVTVAGEAWTATVKAVRKFPRAGIVYIAITEASGAVTAADGPFFDTTLPDAGGGVSYFPLGTSDGSGVLKQIHAGPLVWKVQKPLESAEVAGVIAGVAGKTTPVDADGIGIIDSAAANALKLLSFANLWIWVRKLTDTRYLTPEDAPGLMCRLAADHLLYQGTSTIANNAAVAAWRSSVKCPVGAVVTEYGVTQATGANQPVFKTGIQNSLPGVLFDGVNDYMQASVPFTALIGGYQRTIYIVARPTVLVSTGSGGTYSRPQLIGNASQYDGIALEPSGSNNIIRAWDYDVVGSVTAATAGVAPNGTLLLVHRHKDGVSSISVNQGAWVNGSTLRECNNSSALQIGTSGGAAYFTGYMFDILICNLGHSDTVVSSVGTALKSKWGF